MKSEGWHLRIGENSVYAQNLRCNSLVLRGFGISAKSRALIQVFVELMPELSRDVLMLCQKAKSTHYNVIRVTLFG